MATTEAAAGNHDQHFPGRVSEKSGALVRRAGPIRSGR
jgi:hypothetical protein